MYYIALKIRRCGRISDETALIRYQMTYKLKILRSPYSSSIMSKKVLLCLDFLYDSKF